MKEVEFYDPHPGFSGAVVRLPERMKKAAEDLIGRMLPLEEAMRRLEPVAKQLGGKLEIIEKVVL